MAMAAVPVYADIAKQPAYAAQGLDYGDLCDPEWLDLDHRVFYGFWGDCFNMYRRTDPHNGCAAVHEACTRFASRAASVDRACVSLLPGTTSYASGTMSGLGRRARADACWATHAAAASPSPAPCTSTPPTLTACSARRGSCPAKHTSCTATWSTVRTIAARCAAAGGRPRAAARLLDGAGQCGGDASGFGANGRGPCCRKLWQAPAEFAFEVDRGTMQAPNPPAGARGVLDPTGAVAFTFVCQRCCATSGPHSRPPVQQPSLLPALQVRAASQRAHVPRRALDPGDGSRGTLPRWRRPRSLMLLRLQAQYVDWEERVEAAVETQQASFVILELGCGTQVRAVPCRCHCSCCRCCCHCRRRRCRCRCPCRCL